MWLHLNLEGFSLHPPLVSITVDLAFNFQTHSDILSGTLACSFDTALTLSGLVAQERFGDHDQMTDDYQEKRDLLLPGAYLNKDWKEGVSHVHLRSVGY